MNKKINATLKFQLLMASIAILMNCAPGYSTFYLKGYPQSYNPGDPLPDLLCELLIPDASDLSKQTVKILVHNKKDETLLDEKLLIKFKIEGAYIKWLDSNGFKIEFESKEIVNHKFKYDTLTINFSYSETTKRFAILNKQ